MSLIAEGNNSTVTRVYRIIRTHRAGWDDNHAFLKSADGSFQTFLTGFAQLDFRGYQSGNHPPNTFLVRRARLALEGKVARYYDFKVEGDFADAVGTLLRDAYIRDRREDLRFTGGQFKEPFSQEELRGDAFQDFVERSLVNNLSPSRSPGIMLSGVLNKGAFEYQLGAFNGRRLFGSFYERLYEDLREHQFDFMREAFAEFLTNRVKSQSEPRAIVPSVPSWSADKYISVTQARRLLKITHRTLFDLIKTGEVDFVMRDEGTDLRYLLQLSDIENVKFKFDKAISSRVLARQPGVDCEVINQLTQAGYLQTKSRRAIDGYHTAKFDADAAEKLLKTVSDLPARSN